MIKKIIKKKSERITSWSPSYKNRVMEIVRLKRGDRENAIFGIWNELRVEKRIRNECFD